MKDRKLTQSGSTLLDCTRFSAAMIVFLGHLGPLIPAMSCFVHLAHIAVCIFFVLSGFVIRMITRDRLGNMKDFLIDRGSRIYSVTLPALFMTVICEDIARSINPAMYSTLASSTEPFLPRVIVQFATNLTFTAQSWGYETNPLSNSPFWSLSFECVYYLLFALLFFGARRKSARFLLALVILLSGPAIILLFPTWLLGCLLYDTYIWMQNKPYAFSLITGAFFAVLFMGFCLRRQVSSFMQRTDYAHRSEWLQRLFSPAMRSQLADNTGNIPWLSRFSPSFYMAAVIIFFALLWSLIAIERFLPRIPVAFSARLRWIAEGTFALYLLHLPILMMLVCIFNGSPRYPYLWSAGVVLFCILVSHVFNRLKIAMRTWAHAAFRVRVAGLH